MLEQLAHLRISGQAALGSRDKYTNAFHRHDNAALVLFGDDAFQGGLFLLGRFNGFPHLHRIQTLFGQGCIPLHVVDTDDIGLNLIADLDNIFGLNGRIITQFTHRDITGLLGAQIYLNLGRGNRSNDTSDLISCIQSFEGLLEHFGKILGAPSHNRFFTHCRIDLLYDARRSRSARGQPDCPISLQILQGQLVRPFDLKNYRAYS